MNEIWPELIQSTNEPPKTIDETVERLLMVLDYDHKLVIAAMPEKDLIDLYFSLGLAIRNAFSYWDSRSPSLMSNEAIHRDAISEQIIFELWKRLNQKSLLSSV